MTADNLCKLLEQKYNVLCFVDLADITNSPSSVYKLLEQHYKSAYDNNERLVLYTSQIIPQELLIHLVQATNLIDITNCFILICSSTDVQEQIAQAIQTHSFDKTVIQSLTVNLQPTKTLGNNFILPESVCPIPWMHLEINQDGVYHACCISEKILGSTKTKTLSEAFNSDELQALRSDFLKGEKPSSCQVCWKNEGNGLVSNRMNHKKLLQKEFVLRYLDTPTLSSMDIKPGNTCNFKCRICDEKNSSLYAQELSKIKNIKITAANDWFNDNFINQIKAELPSLTNIDTYGGEPFLIKGIREILQNAIDTGHAGKIRLHYNSNGSVYPEHLIPLWPKFKHIDIQFSIDAVGARFELERGGNWKQVESNILSLKNLNLPNCQISIMPAIGAMNIFYIDEVIEWAEKHGFPVNPLFVYRPAGLGLTALTKESKKQLAKKFKDHSWPTMKSLLTLIQKLPDSDGKEFQTLTKHFDQIRNELFADSHPEIAKLQGMM